MELVPPMIDTIIQPVSTVPWPHIVLIIMAAVLASAIIVISTRRSVRGIARETARMISAIEGARGYSQPSFGPAKALVTTGRGEVIWQEGGFVSRFVKRFRPGSEDFIQMGAVAVGELATQLAALGVDSSDLEEGDPVMATEEVAILTARVNVRNPAIAHKVVEAAIACGFMEEKGVREEITEDDAHQVAGDRAVNDAMRNLETLSNSMRIDRNKLMMVGGDLETLPAEGRVVKIARTHWQAANATAA